MSVINNALAGKKVLVTGATGFIGGRLAERLAGEENAIVVGTGRNLDAVPFVREAGATMQRADLLNASEMQAAIAGQDVIFHVAAWLSNRHGEEEKARQINVDATRNIVQWAHEAGVERVVIVSSIAAYGPPGDVVVREDTHPADPHQPDLYGKTKAEAEIEGLKIGQQLGIEVTAVRPGMVYGPRSYSWSTGMLKLIQRRVPTLFGKADGHAAPVYIDNLIDQMLLAAVRPEAVGEAFTAVDQAVTWNDYFNYYGKMAGRKPIRLPMPLVNVIVWLNHLLRLNIPINRNRIAYYKSKHTYSMEKAERLLGHKPLISIDEGMRLTEAWFRKESMI